MGLRYPLELGQQLLKGLRDMKESVTYQAILEEGRAQGERDALMRLGTRKFGPPDEGVRSVIKSLTDLGQIERLMDRLWDVASWAELLQVTGP